MSIHVITDQQRYEELIEWCRNRPEDAAVRIMIAENSGIEKHDSADAPENRDAPVPI